MARGEPTDEPSTLRSARLEKAVEESCARGDARPLGEATAAILSGYYPERSPGIVRAVGASLAARRGRADAVLRQLANADGSLWFPLFAAAAYGDRVIAGFDPKGGDAALQQLAEVSAVHSAIIDALRARLIAGGEATLAELAGWTDGFLQAYVVLESLAERDLLAGFGDGAADAVVARLDEAFRLADKSSRAAERTQGVRTLRRQLPRQVAILAARFPAVLTWVETKLQTKRPESREVVAGIIEALRKADLSKAATNELRVALEASAKPPRDPSRIVKGMRGRGKKKQ